MRVRGRVQGVGFRPAVWRMAQKFGLDGEVRNDAKGVLIRLCGPSESLTAFRILLEREAPPLARIDSIEVSKLEGALGAGFLITESVGGIAHTEVSPDARICAACADEIRNPAERRFGYALTNCTHCGPRLSIIRSIPYDRIGTTMAPFAMCDACLAEYRDPADRRFHAEPTACPRCGPAVTCVPPGGTHRQRAGDDIAFAAAQLRRGEIIAIKGLGGYQLACDATNAASVARLRAGKRRGGKPFALMARDLAIVRSHCGLSAGEARELASPQAPIVLLNAVSPRRLPDSVAPGLATLGFMLPTTPLHVLLLQDLDHPVVMTSGNLAGEPQIIDDAEASARLPAIASHIVTHDRAIANRIDDSLIRFMDGKPRLLRRARGYAPAPLALPGGFEAAPDILAMGGELKATFCLVKDGQAILSQHQGDLEHPAAFDDYCKNLMFYRDLFGHSPQAIAADMHPEYLSSKLARTRSEPVIEVQHHHAHVASCLCENLYPLDGAPVLGIALDGLGWGADGTFWGGEFLLADYNGFRRLASFKPVAMAGGTLDAMIAAGFNAPPASSCGRLFDAAAAALGLRADRQSYEGDAAARLEALAGTAADDDAEPYPFILAPADALEWSILDPAPMWRALFDDLAAGESAASVAARFHQGLASAIAMTAGAMADAEDFRTVALSGGCFQNRCLFEATARHLRAAGFDVLTHHHIPANDGGIAPGQAAIAAARLINTKSHKC